MSLIGYWLAALVVTYPLVLQMDSALMSHWNVDAEHGLWINWWLAKALESSELIAFLGDGRS
jgi:hypothetical protein